MESDVNAVKPVEKFDELSRDEANWYFRFLWCSCGVRRGEAVRLDFYPRLGKLKPNEFMLYEATDGCSRMAFYLRLRKLLRRINMFWFGEARFRCCIIRGAQTGSVRQAIIYPVAKDALPWPTANGNIQYKQPNKEEGVFDVDQRNPFSQVLPRKRVALDILPQTFAAIERAFRRVVTEKRRNGIKAVAARETQAYRARACQLEEGVGTDGSQGVPDAGANGGDENA